MNRLRELPQVSVGLQASEVADLLQQLRVVEAADEALGHGEDAKELALLVGGDAVAEGEGGPLGEGELPRAHQLDQLQELLEVDLPVSVRVHAPEVGVQLAQVGGARHEGPQRRLDLRHGQRLTLVQVQVLEDAPELLHGPLVEAQLVGQPQVPLVHEAKEPLHDALAELLELDERQAAVELLLELLQDPLHRGPVQHVRGDALQQEPLDHLLGVHPAVPVRVELPELLHQPPLPQLLLVPAQRVQGLEEGREGDPVLGLAVRAVQQVPHRGLQVRLGGLQAQVPQHQHRLGLAQRAGGRPAVLAEHLAELEQLLPEEREEPPGEPGLGPELPLAPPPRVLRALLELHQQLMHSLKVEQHLAAWPAVGAPLAARAARLGLLRRRRGEDLGHKLLVELQTAAGAPELRQRDVEGVLVGHGIQEDLEVFVCPLERQGTARRGHQLHGEVLQVEAHVGRPRRVADGGVREAHSLLARRQLGRTARRSLAFEVFAAASLDRHPPWRLGLHFGHRDRLHARRRLALGVESLEHLLHSSLQGAPLCRRRAMQAHLAETPVQVLTSDSASAVFI
mmetsp:Transcript_23260/g.66116  ORF Transcript_23260/g.66116 Transcript_23260/m.66116 type:complete len:567 (-) Transcript_23260:966-2666(-)